MPNAVELIVKKRDGHELSADEIGALIAGLMSGEIADYQLSAWLMATLFRGMTDAETVKTATLLREINKTRSVVVVEHDMTFVRALDVKVTVLHEGSVLAEGRLDHVSANERVIEVYLGR